MGDDEPVWAVRDFLTDYVESPSLPSETAAEPEPEPEPEPIPAPETEN